jgi:hypothetical protein
MEFYQPTLTRNVDVGYVEKHGETTKEAIEKGCTRYQYISMVNILPTSIIVVDVVFVQQ